MKPFNLEKALTGEPVVTRDGRPVYDLHHLEHSNNAKRLITVIDGTTFFFYGDGIYCVGREESQYDLFMAPVKRTVWGVMYRDCADDNGKLYLYPFLYPTEENARSEMERPINAAKKAIKVFPIEWGE